jgi:beta-glucosidase
MPENAEENDLNRKVDSVLALMNLEDKIGQMSQLSGVGELTGPVTENHSYLEAVRTGQVGSMLNINGVEYTRKLQEITLNETRLGIPLLFGYDVIHGYKTIFPVPLAEACSWDLSIIEKSASVAASEAAAAGQHWTFAPMVDIARDPRWGRIMEGAGEDTYLGGLIAAARVRGFQGSDLSANHTVAACAKHYAAYGAAEGGRDYNTTDMSERTLREVYLPPFKTSADEGVATFMAAFNEISGIPATGNVFLKNILRKEWNYDGMVVSDWNSVGELIPHGIAKNREEAALLSMFGGVDMDMQGGIYATELLELVRQGLVHESMIDDAVRKILRLKFMLGLFEDPFRYCDEQREQEVILCEKHREIARDVARKSIVLLKNEGKTLPLDRNMRSIAVIGPLADDSDNILGGWRARGEPTDAVSVLQAVKTSVGSNTRIMYARGCSINGTDASGFKEAVATAKKADVVVMVVGESADMSGEAHNRSELDLPGIQSELIMEVCKTGKLVIMVLMNGRPLAFPSEAEAVDAILETWFLGTEAGNAIADVLFGNYNPSGKLVATFPYATGQVPIYYNHKNTGRPGKNDNNFNSKYLDAPVEPLFPFGYGLSYTEFTYSRLRLSSDTITGNETLRVSITIRNTGDYAGEEVVQLYLRDRFASVTRPVKELKAFEKIYLKPGEEREVNFNINREMLSFYSFHMKWMAEPGEFWVMVGTNSAEFMQEKFTLNP